MVNNYRAYKYAGVEARANSEIADVALRYDGSFLYYVPDVTKDSDLSLAYTAFDALSTPHFYLVLKNAGALSQDDDIIVSKAISKHGQSLRYASERLRSNYGFVLHAVRQDGTALQWASDKLRQNKKLIQEAVSQDWQARHFGLPLLPELEQERDEIMNAEASNTKRLVENNGMLLQYAQEHLKDLYFIVELAVLQNGLALQFASNRMKKDAYIVSAAIGQTYKAIFFADEAFQRIGDSLVLSRQSTLSPEEMRLKNPPVRITGAYWVSDPPPPAKYRAPRLEPIW